jgi:hypothetical protein
MAALLEFGWGAVRPTSQQLLIIVDASQGNRPMIAPPPSAPKAYGTKEEDPRS